MRKFVKFLAVVLSLSMVAVLFASCGGGNGPEDKTGKTGTSDSKTIKIGSSGPLTGSAATYGISVKNGAQLAVEEINKAGGVNGIKLEFEMQDDEADPEKTLNAYNALKDSGMKIFLGTVTTGACLSIIENTKEDNMFQLTPSASADKVIANDNCFQVCFKDSNQGSVSAAYIHDKKLGTKIGIIYNSSDAYSSGIHDSFVTEAKNKGLNVVADTSFTDDNKTDFSAQLSKCKQGGADFIFLPIYYQEASNILNQADAMGYKPKYFGCDGLDGLLKMPGFNTKLAEGVMLLTPFSEKATDEKTKAFVKAYTEKFDASMLTQFAADAYDGIYIIKTAMEKAGVNAKMSVSEIGDAMKQAMTQIKYDGVTGAGMSWEASGAVTKQPKGVIIKNGVYEPMD